MTTLEVRQSVADRVALVLAAIAIIGVLLTASATLNNRIVHNQRLILSNQALQQHNDALNRQILDFVRIAVAQQQLNEARLTCLLEIPPRERTMPRIAKCKLHVGPG